MKPNDTRAIAEGLTGIAEEPLAARSRRPGRGQFSLVQLGLFISGSAVMTGLWRFLAPRAKSLQATIVSTGFAFVGVLFLCVMLLIVYRGLQIYHEGARTMGVVIGNQRRAVRGRRRYCYFPVVRFRVDGEAYEVIANMSQRDPADVGSLREVTYLKGSPFIAELSSGSGFVVALLITTILGTGMLLASAIYLNR